MLEEKNSEACHRGGMDRKSFHEWKKRFQTHGLTGLKDMPPIPKSQPNQTTPETEAAIIEYRMQPVTPVLGLREAVGAILTNGREFCGTENYPFELYLALNDIEHRRTKVKSPKPTALLNALTRLCWTSSSGLPPGKTSTKA